MAEKLKFVVDADRITLEELINMQSGDLRAMRDVLAHCLMGEDGEYIDYEQAKRTIGQIKLSEVKATAAQFVEQLNSDAVNP